MLPRWHPPAISTPAHRGRRKTGCVTCDDTIVPPSLRPVAGSGAAGRSCPRRRQPSEIEQVGGDQREDDGGIRLDHEARRVDVELAPGDLLVGWRAAVGTVRSGGLGYLAEVTPGPRRALQVLVQERDDADREVARDATADLEEAQPGGLVGGRVPVDQAHHVLDPALHDAWIAIAAAARRREHVAQRGVLPAGDE